MALLVALLGNASVDAKPRVIEDEGPVRRIVVEGSIQEAIDAIPVDSTRPTVVEIPNGIYDERIRIDPNRVTLRGESRTGVVIRRHFPRTEYDKRYDRIGPGVVNLFGDDCVIENLTIDNTATEQGHAFGIYGQPNRTILVECDALGGGDTVSLWNTSHGMYYHTRCRFRGEVDFVCPRGWCYVSDSTFEEIRRTAAIWHDGHMDPSMKFVLRGCRFDGVEDFWLGRNHYPSQFYLLSCQFSEQMADRPIGTVKDLSAVPESEHALYERKYFHDCHREGGDYAWHGDNLSEAAGSPTPDEITPRWTFDGRWDPESTAAPEVVAVETDDDRVLIRFSEPISGADGARVVRADGSVAAYERGDGSRRLVFVGGAPDSAPETFDPQDPTGVCGTVATLEVRYLPKTELPPVKPFKRVAWLLVGDSTVADYAPESPLQGWGWGLRSFVDERVEVVNLAKNGRSSKSFRGEGLWDDAMAKLDAHDDKQRVVFIQFGHNDNPGKGPQRETNPAPGGDYRANLRRYVEEARAAGATPVLVTPPQRRAFDEAGRIVADGPNAPYAEAVRDVAAETDTPLIDLSLLTRRLFDGLGPDTSDRLQTQGDRTHFSPGGARVLAALALRSLRQSHPEFESDVLVDKLSRP